MLGRNYFRTRVKGKFLKIQDALIHTQKKLFQTTDVNSI